MFHSPRRDQLLFQHEPTLWDHFFPRTESFSQCQEFPALMCPVVFCWFAVVAEHLFFDSPSFVPIKLEAGGKTFLGYFWGSFFFFFF